MKSLLIAILSLVITGAPAQDRKTNTTQNSIETSIAAPAIATDSLVNDSITIAGTSKLPAVADECSLEDITGTVVQADDEQYIIFRGNAYPVNTVIDTAMVPYSDYDPFDIVIIAIAIIFPCATIVAAVWFFFNYLLKRNRAKTAVIDKAIEHGYKLPNEFYSGQSPIYTQPLSNGSDTIPHRDPALFSSAVPLIAVGLSILTCFIITDNVCIAWIAGGIPLLIGIGRLIAYFCIPGATNRKRYQRYDPQENCPPCPPPPPFTQHQCGNNTPTNKH